MKKKQVAPSSSTPLWVNLPTELTENILQRLAVLDVLQCEQVCTTWLSVCRDPSMWRFVDGNLIHKSPRLWDKVIREVVNRSQGQLISIKLIFCATDDLLLYIAHRAKQLRSLCITNSGRIYDRGFSKIVKEFPMLDELKLINCKFISNMSIEAAGRSCPLLKSFSFNRRRYYVSGSCDEEAVAVAVNMRGLEHLSMVGNDMTDDGVKAILDGCLNLQSLDLRYCDHVRLNVDLVKQCSQQLKVLKHCHSPDTDDDDDDDVTTVPLQNLRKSSRICKSTKNDAFIYGSHKLRKRLVNKGK